jgi:hypothetical protein
MQVTAEDRFMNSDYNECGRYQRSNKLHLANGVFWDVVPCGSCRNSRFGGMYRLHQQGKKSALVSYCLRCS